MDRGKITYWVSTGLLSLLMLFSAVMYLFNTTVIKEAYVGFGYPGYLVIPLGIAKILGVVAIVSRKSQVLKEFAYAGFFYVSLLGLMGHIVIKDGMWIPCVVGISNATNIFKDQDSIEINAFTGKVKKL